MPSIVRQKKIMEKLSSDQKCSILGPQNLGSRGARVSGPPPPSGSAPAKTNFRHIFLSKKNDVRFANVIRPKSRVNRVVTNNDLIFALRTNLIMCTGSLQGFNSMRKAH